MQSQLALLDQSGVCHVLLLLQLAIFPDEEIRLVNANQVPDDDYASVFDGVAGTAKSDASLLLLSGLSAGSCV